VRETHPERARPHLYGRRKGHKLSARRESLRETLLPKLALRLEQDVDPRAYFGEGAEEVWLEVGFGGGEHLLELAQANPHIGLIGAEPYEEGVAKLLAAVESAHASNIRIYEGDAREVIDALPNACLGRVFILFPDPWPKTRHHKRRFVQMELLDVLARVIYGFRISVLFGLTLTILSSVIGIAAGAVQGYFGGLTDLLMQRFIEIWGGMPVLYLLIIMASLVQPNFWWLLILMLLFSWMSLIHVVRAEFLRARNFDYVRAAKALGASDFRIIFKHILPNAMVATLTFLPFVLNHSITTLTALDFLGFGLPPGSPSLGELLNQGKNNLQAPWLGISAFCVLAAMLTLLIFTGEAVRDAFDPRKFQESKS